ncbi:hypothetical protein ACN38_g3117 [Penicillium nordicum]|uniref:DUF7587 domain-containing protein n=1 Tax=Penicillium nordicum TaxID=229535 RepID=A0A0M9WIB5_9EURO|nr:hypothetical protein ACN38_g3117 [Penicillium nordicum]
MSVWRVTDASSAAQYHPGVGFLALNSEGIITLSPKTAHERDTAVMHIKRHERWGNRRATPLISTYNLHCRATKEAQRRVDAGEQNVILWEIRLDGNDDQDDVEYAEVYDLVEELDFQIPEIAERNAEHEVLFVGQIPRHYVTRRRRLTNRKGERMQGGWVWMN